MVCTSCQPDMKVEGPGWYGSNKKRRTLIFLRKPVWDNDHFPFELKEKLRIRVIGKYVVIDSMDSPTSIDFSHLGEILLEGTGRYQRYQLYKRQIYVGYDVAKRDLFPFKGKDKLWISGEESYLIVRRKGTDLPEPQPPE